MGSFLDTPITHKETERYEATGMKAAMSCMQGWRVSMEDAHVLKMKMTDYGDKALFAVLDGHGGELVAKESASALEKHVTDSEAWQDDHKDPGSIGQALQAGFLSLDSMLKDLPAIRRRDDQSGSTAVSVVLTPTHFVCGNAGDSRSVLVRSSGVVPLSFDHKPYDEGETKRIEAAGCSVSMRRVNGDLAVSRALGDFVYKQNSSLPAAQQAVTAKPDITIEARKPEEDQFLVLACDGIWDVMSNEEIGTYLHGLVKDGVDDLGDLCEAVLDHCLQLGSRDNMSVIIVEFPAAPKPTPAAAEEYKKRRAAAVAAAAAAHSAFDHDGPPSRIGTEVLGGGSRGAAGGGRGRR